MRVFLAGATGAIGRPTSRALVAAGHEVRGVARGPAKAELVRADGAEPIDVSLFDTAALRSALAACDAVLHFATKIPPVGRITRRNFAENDRLRRDASRCLVDAGLAAGVAAYLQESVAFLYADGGDGWLDEEAPLHASWVNDSTLAAERETARFAAGGGRGVVLRFGLFYAPYARSTIDSVRLAQRGLFPVLGPGTQFVSSIHVDDAAAATVAALDVPSGVYNVVEDEPVRFRDYAQALGSSLGVAPRLRLPAWLVRAIMGGARTSCSCPAASRIAASGRRPGGRRGPRRRESSCRPWCGRSSRGPERPHHSGDGAGPPLAPIRTLTSRSMHSAHMRFIVAFGCRSPRRRRRGLRR